MQQVMQVLQLRPVQQVRHLQVRHLLLSPRLLLSRRRN
jgi:hypothetical protein